MSEKSEKSSEAMGEVLLNEASELLRQVAGDRRADETIKGVLRRVGRDVKQWTASRIKDIWYRDPRVRIRANEIEYLASRIGRQVEFVVHSMADRDCGPLDHVFIGGAGIVRAERPFTVFVELERQAGHAAASRSRSHALQAYGLKFLNGLLGAVHSALLVTVDLMGRCFLRQARFA